MSRFWELGKQVIFATLGGYIGAIFGVVAIGKMTTDIAFFLSFFYGLLVIGVIWVIDWIIYRNKKD